MARKRNDKTDGVQEQADEVGVIPVHSPNGEQGVKRKGIQRTMYLMRRGQNGGPDAVVKEFANKYRLRKWFDVARTIIANLAQDTYVLRSRVYSVEAIIDEQSGQPAYDGAVTPGDGGAAA